MDMRATDLIHDLLDEIGKPQVSGETALRLLNEGVAGLSDEAVCAFRRTEILPTVTSKPEYALLSQAVRILRVRYGGKRLDWKSEDALDAIDDTWMLKVDEPTQWTGDRRVRLVPAPQTDSDEITPVGESLLTAVQILTVTGDRYWIYTGGQTPFAFLPGDGRVSDPLVPGSLLVEYAFQPAPLDTDTEIPQRFTKALRSYLAAMLTAGDPNQQMYASMWEAEKQKLGLGQIDPKWEFRHYEAVQQALASGQPLPQLALQDYENIVHQAMNRGDPTGKNFALGGRFLLEAVQRAVAEGKAVPGEIVAALNRYAHDVTPYLDDFFLAFDWRFLVGYMQRQVGEGNPIPDPLLKAYLARQKVVAAGPHRRSLIGELF